jgi:NAD(P)H-hydrate epimerase
MSTSGDLSKAHFFTDNGRPVATVTAQEMREVDRIATEETGPNIFQMMENAGRNLALLAIQLLGKDWQKAQIIVLAGAGGNGGGGICAARHLANRDLEVRLCLARPEGLGEIAAWQRKVFLSAGGSVIATSDLPKMRPDLILDALIGYGLKSAPDENTARLIQWANSSGAPILALDVPSGLDATTGEAPGACIAPKWTITLALPKTGLLPEKTGELYLADLGIPGAAYRRLRLEYLNPFGPDFIVRLHRQ